MTLGFDGATARAPTEPTGTESKIGVQVRPASPVSHTPPFTAPKKKWFGSPGTPVTVSTRPPRNGPMERQCSGCNSVWSGAGSAGTRTATTHDRTKKSASTPRNNDTFHPGQQCAAYDVYHADRDCNRNIQLPSSDGVAGGRRPLCHDRVLRC